MKRKGTKLQQQNPRVVKLEIPVSNYIPMLTPSINQKQEKKSTSQVT
jgi:hypothetical protein